jgi:hypothetical protein
MASTRILCTGKIEHGVILTKHAYVEYLCSLTQDDDDEAWQEEEDKRENPCSYPDYPLDHTDGALQNMIDYAAELQELIEGRLDEEFWARGGW